MRKTNRGIVVTGASSGIGLVTARSLVQVGYQVFGTSRKSPADPPAGVTILACDVTDEASVQRLVDEVAKRAVESIWSSTTPAWACWAGQRSP